MTKYKAVNLSPVIPSTDVAHTTNFFYEVLGFSSFRNYGYYSIVFNDAFSVHISEAKSECTSVSIYLEVDDIELFWNTVKGKIDMANSKPPFDQPYEMREAIVSIPNTKSKIIAGQSVIK